MSNSLYEDKNPGYFSGERREMLAFLPQKCERLLDIGCGEGGFGALLKSQRKCEVWGVDINKNAIEIAKQRIDTAIVGDLVSNTEIPDGYFDAITFNDSLEHFIDPISALNFCKNKLADKGKIICCLPNVRYFENIKHLLIDMDWKYEDSGILDYTHLRFYTKKSMSRLFDEQGFKVESVVGIKPHYWSGKKIFLLRLFLDKYIEDMKYLNYVVTASL